MKTSLKDRASATYLEMKGKLGRKLASMERQVVRMDAGIVARVKARREQLAVTLDRTAAKVRRTSK